MPITAQYHGVCAECEEPIVPGQRIETIDDQWQHVNCGELPKAAPCVCEKCWLVHAPQQRECA